MKKITMLILTIAIALMLSVSTASAWSVSVEPLGCINPVADGDTFFADVFFNPDEGGNLLQSYGFSIGYDTNELEWVSTNAGSQNTPPPPLFSLGDPFLRNGVAGMIEGWNGASLTSGALLTEKTGLAHIEFVAHPDMGCDGELDVWMMGGSATAFLVDDITSQWGDFNLVEGPSVAAVPIPGTVLILGSGLLSIFGIRRKKLSA